MAVLATMMLTLVLLQTCAAVVVATAALVAKAIWR
jgi:hypothetical protein